MISEKSHNNENLLFPTETNPVFSTYKKTTESRQPETSAKVKAQGVSFEEAALHNGDISVYRRWVPLTEEDKQLFYSRGDQYKQFTLFLNKHECEEFHPLSQNDKRKWLLAHLQPSLLEHYNLKTFHAEHGRVMCNLMAKNFRAHEHNFGKAAQKRFFTCFDNYINIFEATHSTNRELLQYSFNNGYKTKTDYRRPVFMTLTVPRQVRYTKTITITEAEALEHLKTIKTETAPPGTAIDTTKLQKAYQTLKDLNFPGRNCIAEIIKMLKRYVTVKKTEQIIFFSKETPEKFTISIGTSDKEIKKNCLDRFFENLKKTYGLRMVLWKAEAQLRGVIHFHCLIDAFILEATARKLWYGILKRNRLHNPEVTMQHSSNLTNFQIVPRLASMKYEFAGYFAHQTDRTENIKYKHRNETVKNKGWKLKGQLRDARVRNIEGNTWGSTDNLKYRPFTITDIDNELVQDLLANAFEVRPYKTAKGDICGGLYLTKKCELVHLPEVDSEKKVYQTRKISLQYLEPMLHRYHYAEAEKIYSGTVEKIDYSFKTEVE